MLSFQPLKDRAEKRKDEYRVMFSKSPMYGPLTSFQGMLLKVSEENVMTLESRERNSGRKRISGGHHVNKLGNFPSKIILTISKHKIAQISHYKILAYCFLLKNKSDFTFYFSFSVRAAAQGGAISASVVGRNLKLMCVNKKHKTLVRGWLGNITS